MPDRPLLVTADLALLDDLVRLAAAAGCETQVAPDIGSVGPAWQTAPLVLLGVDALEAAVRSGLISRPGVLVVSAGGEPGWVWAAAASLGAEGVAALPGAEDLLLERLLRLGAPEASPGVCVAVVGGRGGAGASTTATALAVAGVRARGRDAHVAHGFGGVMLVDLDALGGGLDLVLGAEEAPGLRWPDLVAARGRTDPSELHAALPVVNGVSLLSWHRGPAVELTAEAVTSVLEAGRTGHDLVILDLPRSWSRSPELLRDVLAGVDVAVLVVPAELRAVAAAAQVGAALTEVIHDVRLLVRGPSPAGLTADHVAARLGLPLAGFVAAEPGLSADLERGEPPGRSGKGPLARFCAGFVVELMALHVRDARPKHPGTGSGAGTHAGQPTPAGSGGGRAGGRRRGRAA